MNTKTLKTKREMKVLMLGWELPPYNSGGLGVACYQLCKELSKTEVDIEFVLPYSADHDVDFMKIHSAGPFNAEFLQSGGVAYDSFRYVDNEGQEHWVDMFGQTQMYERAVDRIIKLADFDIIHAHDWLTFRAGLRAKQASNKPLILHVHSVESDRAAGQPGNPMVREIEGLSFLLADKIISVSNHTKNAIMRDYDIPEDKITVIHNSIDISNLEPLENDNVYSYLSSMKGAGYRVVVNIGRLTVQKGLVNFLRAAQKVVAQAPKTVFLIVGSGEQYTELVEQAAQLGISKNVVFTGFLRGKKWRDAYAIGDLFVMPSVSEPFGLTPLEAIGYGTPALISKQSGVSEVIKNSLKVDYWDVDEMANQITSVVMNDGLRDSLHANSLHEYHQLSWSESARKLQEIYQNHLQGAVA